MILRLRVVQGKKNDMEEMRRCPSCKVVKPIEDYLFTYQPRKGRRFPGYCKVCRHEKMKSWISRNREKHLALRRAAQKRYEQKHPDKVRAHQKALKMKHTLLKESCQECGSNNRLEMHHPDYSQPEYVITLCSKCHHNITNKIYAN